MDTTQSPTPPIPSNNPEQAPNRQAMPQELDHAIMLLGSFSSGVAVSIVEMSAYLEPEENSPVLVTTDFDNIGHATILLVPPGKYQVASSVLGQVTHIIGLTDSPDLYPILVFDGEASDVVSANTGVSFSMRVFPSNVCFVNVVLQAFEPTVLETCFGSMDDKQFSDLFFNVEWCGEIDALNTYASTFLHGRNWAMEAYGEESYRTRNGIEKGLDCVHQGVMNAIDNTFRPLVRLGESLDKILGLK